MRPARSSNSLFLRLGPMWGWGVVLLFSSVYWGMQVWQWSAPMATPAPVVVSTPVAAQAAPVPWAQLLDAGASSAKATSTASQWKLLGVVSAHGGSGLAMLASPNGEELLVRSGDTLGPGLVLLQVHADRVLLGADEQSATLLSMPSAPKE